MTSPGSSDEGFSAAAVAVIGRVRLGPLVLRSAVYEFNPAGVVLDLTYRELLATGSLNLIAHLELRSAITRLGDLRAVRSRLDGLDQWMDLLTTGTESLIREVSTELD